MSNKPAKVSIDDLIPGSATHPGEILLDELKARGIGQAEFARQIGVQKTQLNEVIKGKRSVNEELALLLEASLGVAADFWLRAQNNYSLDLARIKGKDSFRILSIHEWRNVTEAIPVDFFKKKGLLTGDPVDDLNLVKKVYGITDLSQLQQVACAPSLYRMSTKLKSDERNITAWLRYVQYQSQSVKVKSFDLGVKDDLISELKLLIKQNKNLTKQVQDTLADAGIKLIYEEKGFKTPIDGISFWSNDNPSIGMTLRHSRIDNYAFTLFHELGHVFLHLSEGPLTEFVDFDAKFTEESYTSDPKEQEANRFAQNYLISPEIWRKYVRRGFMFNDYIIYNMADNAGIHPAVVKGRLCHELNNYKIRSSIENKIK